MPILDRSDALREELRPGVGRWRLLDSETGAESLTVAEVTVAPEFSVPTHVHPTEEAMVILEGELEAALGDDVITVTEGQTVLTDLRGRETYFTYNYEAWRIEAMRYGWNPETYDWGWEWDANDRVARRAAHAHQGGRQFHGGRQRTGHRTARQSRHRQAHVGGPGRYLEAIRDDVRCPGRRWGVVPVHRHVSQATVPSVRRVR